MANGLRRPRQTIIQRITRALGEISVLRTAWPRGWGFQYMTPYRLDSSRVDYALARELYRNTNDKYKLGAGFARPIVDTCAGFMGAPHFTHPDPEAARALEEDMERWTGKLLQINRDAIRDGDVFVRIMRVTSRFDPRKREAFALRLIPPEWVTPVVDPVTGSWQKLIIRYPVTVTDDQGRTVSEYTLTEVLADKARTIEADVRAPADVRARNRTEENPWGFIPVVHFRNEPEETQLYGASDLEPVEPFMKAYHDTMLFAVQGSKYFSRPKVKFRLRDVAKFLTDNFSPEEIQAGKLKFADKEIFLLQEGDDAEFISADSGLEGITTLLKFLFFCYDDQTEALTENGWKLFKDVEDGERLATRTPDGRLEYHLPTRRIAYHYRGPMYVLESTRINFAVTPGHRMLVGKGGGRRAEERLRLTPVDELRGRYAVPRANRPYTGTVSGIFEVPCASDPVYKGVGRRPKRTPALPPVQLVDFARFLGLWISDGHLANGHRVIIRQSKSDTIAYIDQAMERLGWPYRRAVYNGMTHWEINSLDLYEYLKPLGLQPDRYLPQEVFHWAPDAVQALLDGLMVGDGVLEGRQGRYSRYHTSSKRLADDIQRLLIHAGVSSRVRKVREAGAVVGELRGQQMVAKTDHWEVQINNRHLAMLDASRIEQRMYDGMVYCFTVPNHTLMVRRHGVAMWCGNCIVDVSETPEFAFGTAVQSSKASVSEQMVPLARKIRRKRGLFEEPYGELASMYLAMWSKVNNRTLESYQVGIGWDELSPRNDKEVAETIKTLVEGLVAGLEAGLVSVDAAAEFLREFVPSMLPWVDPDADDDERRRVAKTFLLRKRLEDGLGLEPEEPVTVGDEGAA